MDVIRNPFDTEHLRCEVSSFSGDMKSLSQVIEVCLKTGVRLLFWTPQTSYIGDNDAMLASMSPGAFFLPPENVLYEFKLNVGSIGVVHNPGLNNINRVPVGSSTEALEDLSLIAGTFSRYRRDPFISRAKFENVYRAWMVNSVNKVIADEVFVYRSSPQNTGVIGKEIGVITVRVSKDGQNATIGLFAVDPACRRSGVGTALITHVLSWAASRGCAFVYVTTQSDNDSACGIYNRIGFVEQSRRATYHIWLPTFDMYSKLLAGESTRLVTRIGAPGPPPAWIVRHTSPYVTGREKNYIQRMLETRSIDSLGPYFSKCKRWIQDNLGCEHPLITGSGTAALEHASMLCDLNAGDEVIMPSFTFPSTANAVVLRGAIPVFVDVRPDTFNIDVTLIEAAITPKTKAIFVVHYAGVACDMDEVMEIANKHGLIVVEDAAQAVMSTYKGRYLGTIGHLGCLSFHYTKNVICGEGGALLVNDAALADRAYVVWEKGTNRFDFIKGKVDKYCWIDIGSSFVPSEAMCAFLYAQLEEAVEITRRRTVIWSVYKQLLQPLIDVGKLQASSCNPPGCETNGHIFFIVLSSASERDTFKASMQELGVQCFSHYLALHESPSGRKFGFARGSMTNTFVAQDQLLRLPLFAEMTAVELHHVAAATHVALGITPPSFARAFSVFQQEWNLRNH